MKWKAKGNLRGNHLMVVCRIEQSFSEPDQKLPIIKKSGRGELYGSSQEIPVLTV